MRFQHISSMGKWGKMDGKIVDVSLLKQNPLLVKVHRNFLGICLKRKMTVLFVKLLRHIGFKHK